jgi:hypothetical protein
MVAQLVAVAVPRLIQRDPDLSVGHAQHARLLRAQGHGPAGVQFPAAGQCGAGRGLIQLQNIL